MFVHASIGFLAFDQNVPAVLVDIPYSAANPSFACRFLAEPILTSSAYQNTKTCLSPSDIQLYPPLSKGKTSSLCPALRPEKEELLVSAPLDTWEEWQRRWLRYGALRMALNWCV